MAAARAAPEPIPKTAMATAIASSKLLLAAVKDCVAVGASSALIRAMKTGSYHSSVYLRNSRNRVSIPPKKGIPRWMKTLSVALTRPAHEADFRLAGQWGHSV